MRHTIRERARERRAQERLLFAPTRGGDLSICLVYPNTYPVGMANLGFQAVFEILACHPRVHCERAFLPDRDEPDREVVSLRERAPTSRLRAAGVLALVRDRLPAHRRDSGAAPASPPLRAARGGGPLLVAGGPATFLNPEPIADFFDLFLIGEGEEMVPEFLARYSRRATAAAVATGCSMRRPRSRVRTGRIATRSTYARRRDDPVRVLPGPGSGRRATPSGRRSRPLHHRLEGPRAGGGVRRHVSRRGEPRLRVGLPLLRRRIHVPSGPQPQPRRRSRRRSPRASRERAHHRPRRRRDGEPSGNRGALRVRAERGGRASPSSLKADVISRQLARRARTRRQSERHDRARGGIGAHAAGHQQEPDRARDPPRRRLARRAPASTP